MIIRDKENLSGLGENEIPFTNTAVQDLREFLAVHFQRLEDFFNLMDYSRGNANCHMCEFSSMGRFFLQTFKEETEQVRQAIERDFGKIHVARVNTRSDILGVIAVQPAPPGEQGKGQLQG